MHSIASCKCSLLERDLAGFGFIDSMKDLQIEDRDNSSCSIVLRRLVEERWLRYGSWEVLRNSSGLKLVINIF